MTSQGCCVITILNETWGAVASASIPPLAMRSSFVLSRGIAGVPDTPSHLRLDVGPRVACNEVRQRRGKGRPGEVVALEAASAEHARRRAELERDELLRRSAADGSDEDC
jgi:hypothetical protein